MTELRTAEGATIAEERKEIEEVFLESARAIRDVLKRLRPIALNAQSVCGGIGPLRETIAQAAYWAVLQYRRCVLDEPLSPARWAAHREEIEQLLREEKK